MKLFDWFKQRRSNKLNEEMKAFKNVSVDDDDSQTTEGEGKSYEDYKSLANNITSFNSFFNNYINKSFENKISRIYNYRLMSEYPEINDVIEDAMIESTREDRNNKLLNLEILDEKLANNKNSYTNIYNEFKSLFYRKIKIADKIGNWFNSFLVDGELYVENVIKENNKKEGIINLKKLPPETMDTIFDNEGKFAGWIQYLKRKNKPKTVEEAKKDKDIIFFYPHQIHHIKYKSFNKKRQYVGYLDKVKQPYNILKMLETSVIIYRIIRAPERLVFKIDVGNMPRDRAMKYVSKVKDSLQKKETFNPDTGTIEAQTSVMNLLENYFLPVSENRGSDISSVGGNPSGFAELDDIYYFQRKLYKALKYPLSRISNKEEKQEGDNLFGGGSTFAEIARDEVKWSVFLENQQMVLCNEIFLPVFLIHLEFKGMKSQYELNNEKIQIIMNTPNDYKTRINQSHFKTKVENYMDLANNPEFSKSFLMKTYLEWDDEKIKENSEGKKKDKELGFEEESKF